MKKRNYVLFTEFERTTMTSCLFKENRPFGIVWDSACSADINYCLCSKGYTKRGKNKVKRNKKTTFSFQVSLLIFVTHGAILQSLTFQKSTKLCHQYGKFISLGQISVFF